jgi:hypothetical protein
MIERKRLQADAGSFQCGRHVSSISGKAVRSPSPRIRGGGGFYCIEPLTK